MAHHSPKQRSRVLVHAHVRRARACGRSSQAPVSTSRPGSCAWRVRARAPCLQPTPKGRPPAQRLLQIPPAASAPARDHAHDRRRAYRQLPISTSHLIAARCDVCERARRRRSAAQRAEHISRAVRDVNGEQTREGTDAASAGSAQLVRRRERLRPQAPSLHTPRRRTRRFSPARPDGAHTRSCETSIPPYEHGGPTAHTRAAAKQAFHHISTAARSSCALLQPPLAATLPRHGALRHSTPPR